MSLKKFLQNYRIEDWYLRGIMPEEMQAEAPIARLLNCGPYIYDDSDAEAESGGEADDEAAAKKKFRARLTKEILGGSDDVDEKSTNDNNNKEYVMPKIAQLVEPYVWMSAGETSSLLHSHPEHNLHCVLDGRKDFILIPVAQFQHLTTSTDPEKKFAWRRELDLYETFKNSDEWYLNTSNH